LLQQYNYHSYPPHSLVIQDQEGAHCSEPTYNARDERSKTILSAPLPSNEHERISGVQTYKLLDISSNECFDRLVDLTHHIFHVPIAYISIMDADRQWFKACHGLTQQELPREQAFCAWTVLQDNPLVVPDAIADSRFTENPLVSGEAHIRFYAGVPIHDIYGHILGTLAIMDHITRQMQFSDLEILCDLAKVVEREVTVRIESERINEHLHVLQAITDTAQTHFTLDELLQAIIGQIRTIMRADNIAILLLDEKEQYLTVRAVQGIEELVANDVYIPLGKGFAGTIAARGVPLIVDDNSTVEILNPVLREEIHSLLGTPLIVRERVIGVVHIGMKRHRYFTNHDISLFQRVADRLALAIERANLYEEEQHMREELQAHVRLLTEINAHQRNFVSVVSHEFRTTLTGIQGFSGILQNEAFTPEEVKDFATDIHQDSLRLQRMINDLLDLEKMRGGQASLHIETFQLTTVLQEQIERCKAITGRHTFRMELDDDLPALEADRDKISQVIANLLSNAIKYWPEGGEITIVCQREAETAHVQIHDNGIGIPTEALIKIFDAYNRIPSDKTRYIHGTGLGLAIVKQIVEIHGGKVWAESPLTSGTTLHVVLPLKYERDDPVIPSYTTTTATATAISMPSGA
jgi:signal transduction histidine kinase